MSEKVKLSKDGSSIDFVQSDSLPTSMKKFRQSPEIEGFYRFIFENDLQKEAFEILDRIVTARKAKKLAEKAQAKQKEKEEHQKAKELAQIKKAKAVEPQAKAPVKAALTAKKAAVVTKAKPVATKLAASPGLKPAAAKSPAKVPVAAKIKKKK